MLSFVDKYISSFALFRMAFNLVAIFPFFVDTNAILAKPNEQNAFNLDFYNFSLHRRSIPRELNELKL